MLQIIAIDQLPLLNKGDDLARMIVARVRRLGFGIKNRDILVIGQKAISKTEGRVVNIDQIKPSGRAERLARRIGKRPEFIEVVLRDSRRVLRADRDAFVVVTKDGQTCMNGGVDKSNIQRDNMYSLLPENPDASARLLRRRIKKLTGKEVGVVICDTRSRPFRRGQVEECIGVAGMSPLVDYRGQKDLFGYKLRFKNVALADELASAAELVMGQGREATPVAIIRGLTRVRFQEHSSAKNMGVTAEEDLFRGTL